MVQLATSAAFVSVGRTLARDPEDPGERGAARAFRAWWFGIAGLLALECATTILAATDALPTGLLVAIRCLGILLVAAGFWGLTYYAWFLWTGRAAMRAPLAAWFALLALALIAFLLTHSPQGVDARRWSVIIAFAEPVQGPLYAALLAGFALPPIAAALGYLSLWRHAPRREQRWRIALVGLSVVLYIGAGLVVRIGTSDALQLANLTIGGPGTALAAFWAYHPPRSLHVWLGRATRDDDARRRRAEALDQRCRDLI